MRLRALVVLLLAGPVLGQAVRYGRDVRPILTRNCFPCHGPDAADRKGELRLDVPGQASEVPLLERITSPDRKHHMPPPRSGKALTAAQVDVLKRWLAHGAKYERHWSFVAPRRPALPVVAGAVHPVDRFIRSALPKHGLRPSPRADRARLLRRVHLDLIGLPPSLAETRAFLADRSAGAYEKVVDRLLASKHYGERWARRWLDLARYADTNGYEKDRDRSIWPYRDWVIRAYNRDLPYDRFVIEQLAGDLLPNATESQRIATGFHRNTMLNEEGGIDPLEYRFYAMTDRVSTTGTALLGLTLGCARCHTHKFDPITQRDYYGMMAFLDNADEPDYSIVSAADRADFARRQREAAKFDLAAQWPAQAPPLADEFRRWLTAKRATASRWRPLIATAAVANLPKLVVDRATGIVDAYGDITKHDVFELRFRPLSTAITALRLEALPADRLPDRGPGMTYFEGRKGDFFLTEFELRADGKPVKLAKATESNAQKRAFKSPLAFDGDIQTGWANTAGVGRRAVAIFVLATPIPAGAKLELTMHFGRHYPATLGRFRLSATHDLRGDATHAMGEALDDLLARSDAALSDAERSRLRHEFLLRSPHTKRAADRLRGLLRPPRRIVTLVMQERPADHRRTTHLHHRGEFLQKREPVAPHVPAALHPFPASARKDRLGFARWLVARDNPLAARVAVNRHWAALFGAGLVRTIGDFGVPGELPSHPELLDWLAVEFMARGWSIKRLHRLLVTSETYKQDSRVRAVDRADPANRWLARGPRFRLEGELLRDSLLHAAGLLDATLFGPPVRPPQPPGVTEVAYRRPKWRASKGSARFRRSIYTFQKRTAPFAFYETFDAPSGEECLVQRDRSNTPLQALTMLNDPMVMEIAEAFGKRVVATAPGETDADRVAHAFALLLTRPVTPAELETLVAFVRAERARGTKDVWTALARALFALDETLTRN